MEVWDSIRLFQDRVRWHDGMDTHTTRILQTSADSRASCGREDNSEAHSFDVG